MALKDSYFNISEAAIYLGVTRQTVSRWIAEGKIIAEKVGNVVLIEKNHIYDYENERVLKTIADGITQLVGNRVRREFDLSKDDAVQFVDYKNAEFTFSIARADGVKQRAVVKVGEIALDRKKWRLFLPVTGLSLGDPEPNSETGKARSNKDVMATG